MHTVFERLTYTTLRELIAEKIRHAILTGSLREGERLVERRLASQFETSVTAVREALIQVEAEGFVTKKPNSATYVTKLSREAAEKMFEARRVLETYAVEKAARLATPEDIQRLEKRYAELLEAAATMDTSLFMRTDFSFHQMVWEIADNEYVATALHRIVLPIFGFESIRIHSQASFDRLRDAHSHLPIIEAIKAKDADSARTAFLAALDEWLSNTRIFVFGHTGLNSTRPRSQGESGQPDEPISPPEPPQFPS